ncbi:MAG TPA: 30S ribosomal protein S12 methylthiotransferase RimO [Propioniciclava sp.]|jgi:ribosomal protein S12 methylthiotransferase|uniref:30S ribosomal protein S12 methylthiotransferase RimO n=1 Tax=Propioniciclava sp. TaxID=2038686 RepID=UPI002C257742|nr:30S ribosomal protein S12 methylthiotransferase RimO [Propioniciclava sp.]HRL48370.1 30S ribosomal protein S12 methylthiotransferase RimO [Propioniciclava sp.]HRL79207.1 30S ribosomal protein S12 methylthiotransferase RimO [Propioniciclava sp.]
MTSPTRVHIVSLGCARNDVDSEELAGRLEAGGFELVDEPAAAEAVVVNTCGFIESAKKDSIDTLLAASDLKGSGVTQRVVAVGCMAERYGTELADALPEADAVLGFDDYADIDSKLRLIMAGAHLEAHTPTDRRRLLPLAPADRPDARSSVSIPGLSSSPDLPEGVAPASGPRPMRRRIGGGPSAPVKIASGCDRRCAFCAIPSFRGSFVSRPAHEIVAEASWLADHGVREAFLVSENTSSYGKDLREIAALERLLGDLSRIPGLDWVRVSYLQPAETRPGLIEAMCSLDKVVPYFDLSFQHAAPAVLRRMRRFGDPESFLGLLERIRALQPSAGVRSNVIVGFPGETEEDVEILIDFLSRARLDALGVFAYSDEEGTEGVGLADHVSPEVIADRFERVSDLAALLVEERARERIGERVRVLIESVEDGVAIGRAAHQGPEVDGTCALPDATVALAVGDLVWGRVVAAEGVDLIVREEQPQ